MLLLAVAYSKYSSSKSVQVVIDDYGFHPEVITISPNTKVTWINKGGFPHWPASDPHPVHTDYPDKGGCIGSSLDACRGLKAGEKFSFRFKSMGEWGMHDHLYPSYFMTVIVRSDNIFSRFFNEAPKSPATSMPSISVFKSMSRFDQEKKLTTLAELDPKQAWLYLKSAYGDDGLVGNTHQYAHTIGSNLFKKLGSNGVAVCDSSYAFGCYHGFAEQSIKDLGIAGAGRMAEVCARQSGQAAGNCLHGLGHGFTNYRQFLLQPALDDCSNLKVKKDWESTCQNGVFMEYTSGVVSSKLPTGNNLWQFCDRLNRIYDNNCGYYIANIALYRLKLDEPTTAGICEKGTYRVAVASCVAGYANYVTRLSNNIQIVEQNCRQNLSSWTAECIKQAAVYVTFGRRANWETDSRRLCEYLSGLNYTDCMSRRERYLRL